MKKTISIFYSIAVMLFAIPMMWSCEETIEPEPVPDPEPEPEELTFEMTPAAGDLLFSAAHPAVYEFSVTTNDTTWQVTSDVDWCVIEQGPEGFTVTAQPSVSSDAQTTGTVSIVATDTLYASFKVDQSGLEMYFGGNMDGWAAYWHDGQSYYISQYEAKDISDMVVSADGTVHVVGRSNNVGYYWSEQTGIFSLVTSSDEYVQGSASGIYLDEATGDVYCTSYEGSGAYYTAKYWKNLAAYDLTDGTTVALAYDVLMYDGSLYILVDDSNGKYYLVGDEKHMLEDNGYAISPSCMTVKDGTVYVGGYYTDVDKFCPCYWVDGKLTTIPTAQNSQIYAIGVDDSGNIYLAGSEGVGIERCAAYYKNGDIVRLTDYNNSCISDMDIVGEHVFLLGSSTGDNFRTYINYWIDGEEYDLTDPNVSSAWGNTIFLR